jgi:hypothetical protein
MSAVSLSAERMKRYRVRQHAGIRIAALEVDAHAVAERMISSGRLSEVDAMNDAAVDRALERLIAEWCNA